MPDDARATRIRRFLVTEGWAQDVSHVTFLAAGEYNENYLVQADGRKLVFRINHGSQLGLANQIEYEFAALQAVEASGVTPKAYRVKGPCREFANGALLMQYLPGTKLNYHTDAAGAARLFARIHSLPTSENLLVQADPLRAIVAESRGLLARYPDHPRAELRPKLETYLERMVVLTNETEGAFADEPMCIVNTEVNSGNFLVHNGTPRLVDWEKAVISYRYQDLGHFLVPTTTLWKDEFRFGPEARAAFLDVYHEEIRGAVSREEIDRRTALLERVILLRAYSWCYMALAEYAVGRTLSDPSTAAKIEYYFSEIDRFLEL